MCCGQKRSQLQSSPQSNRVTAIPPSAQAPRAGQMGQAQPLRSVTGMVNFAPQSRIHTPARGLPSFPPTPPMAPNSAVTLRYLDRQPVRMQGPVTGRFYQFSASQPVQSVDARDAVSLLNNRLFRRA